MDNKRKRGKEEARERGKEGDGKRTGKQWEGVFAQ